MSILRGDAEVSSSLHVKISLFSGKSNLQMKSEEFISEGLCKLCFKSFNIRTPY